LALIKPDVSVDIESVLAIRKLITDSGFVIAEEKMVWLSDQQAGHFYAEHEHKSFFSDLLNFMTR
jgi:nucleoside-diphosphate kinase